MSHGLHMKVFLFKVLCTEEHFYFKLCLHQSYWKKTIIKQITLKNVSSIFEYFCLLWDNLLNAAGSDVHVIDLWTNVLKHSFNHHQLCPLKEASAKFNTCFTVKCVYFVFIEMLRLIHYMLTINQHHRIHSLLQNGMYCTCFSQMYNDTDV